MKRVSAVGKKRVSVLLFSLEKPVTDVTSFFAFCRLENTNSDDR